MTGLAVILASLSLGTPSESFSVEHLSSGVQVRARGGEQWVSQVWVLVRLTNHTERKVALAHQPVMVSDAQGRPVGQGAFERGVEEDRHAAALCKL